MTTFGGMALIAGGALLGGLFSAFLNIALRWFFRLFNFGFNWATNFYTRGVGLMLRASVIVLVVYAGLIVLTYFSFTTTPTGFIPQQDKGFLLVNVRLPDGSSVARTRATMQRIEDLARFRIHAGIWSRLEAPLVPEGQTATIRRQLEAARGLASGRAKDEAGRWARNTSHRPDGIYRTKKRPGVNHTVAVSGQSLLLNANRARISARCMSCSTPLKIVCDPDCPQMASPRVCARGVRAVKFEAEEFGRLRRRRPSRVWSTAGGFKMVDRGPRQS